MRHLGRQRQRTAGTKRCRRNDSPGSRGTDDHQRSATKSWGGPPPTQTVRDALPKPSVSHVPALAGGLTADAKAVADFGPGVAKRAESDHRILDRGVQLAGEADHRGEGFDITGADPAAVGAHDSAGEGGVLVV